MEELLQKAHIRKHNNVQALFKWHIVPCCLNMLPQWSSTARKVTQRCPGAVKTPAPSRQKSSRKRTWSPLASLEKYFAGRSVRSHPWTYRFCFSWPTDVDCVMPLLIQTDLGMEKCAKACNAKCFKKKFIQGWKEKLWKERPSDHNLNSDLLFLPQK